jgi:hypothetical protein
VNSDPVLTSFSANRPSYLCDLPVKIGLVFALLLLLSPFACAQQAENASAESESADDNASAAQMAHRSLAGAFESGTAWSPDSTPHYMWMLQEGSWNLAAHGNLIIGYDQQGGPRGKGKAESSNWLMLMEDHKLGRGSIEFRQMLSAEPLTTPHPGFPELFQTGETYHGRPLVDYQHPHDVFGEISVRVLYPLTKRITWLFYGGPAAEPALGPVAFLHRLSAMDNPAAPLGHHLQDSTHISYGVVTSGVIVGPVKLEGSAFNGREPDEKRYNFDLGALDSWSARASLAPSKNWVAQYSYGHLVHPEALEPANTDRQTASISYNRPLGRGDWSNTLVWGRNRKESAVPITNSYLYESDLNFAEKNYAYSRMELVDKDELDLQPPLTGRSFRIGAFTFGGVRDFIQNAHGQIGLGADVTFYSKPSALDPIYGVNPVSFHIFLRLRPPKMSM